MGTFTSGKAIDLRNTRPSAQPPHVRDAAIAERRRCAGIAGHPAYTTGRNKQLVFFCIQGNLLNLRKCLNLR